MQKNKLLRVLIIGGLMSAGAMTTGIWLLTRNKELNIFHGPLFILMGIVMLYVIIRISILRRKGLKQIDWLKQNGRKAEAIFFKVNIDYEWEDNKPDRYFIVCKWVDVNTGKEYTFSSEKSFNYDPSSKISEGKKFTVWYDPNDPEGKHYMDTEFLR